MSTLDLHTHTAEGTIHVCTIHRSAGDQTPLQMISTQQLAQLQAAEAELAALLAARAVPAAEQHPAGQIER